MTKNEAKYLLPQTMVIKSGQPGTLRRFHFINGEAGWLIDWKKDGLKFARLDQFTTIEILPDLDDESETK